jgi:hypothetical protein
VVLKVFRGWKQTSREGLRTVCSIIFSTGESWGPSGFVWDLGSDQRRTHWEGNLPFEKGVSEDIEGLEV